MLVVILDGMERLPVDTQRNARSFGVLAIAEQIPVPPGRRSRNGRAGVVRQVAIPNRLPRVGVETEHIGLRARIKISQWTIPYLAAVAVVIEKCIWPIRFHR